VEAANQGVTQEVAIRGAQAPNEATNQKATQEVAGQGAQAPHYNLRPRRNDIQSTFQQAIDTPHNGKSYFPPRQLMQQGYTLTQYISRVLKIKPANRFQQVHFRVRNDPDGDGTGRH
jgi:hypothetical protein